MIFLVGLSNQLDFASLCTTKAVKYRNCSMALLTRCIDYGTSTAAWGKGYLHLGRRLYLTMGTTRRSSTRWWEQRRTFRGIVGGCNTPQQIKRAIA